MGSVARLVRVSLTAFVAVPTLAWSQDPNAAAHTARAKAALAPIAALAGQWQGEADVMVGRGQQMRVLQSEDIVWGAAGTTLFIRGTGRSTEAANQGEIVFEAAAILWFDADSGCVRMRTFRDGQSLEASIEVRPDTLVWGFPVPGGSVHYTIAFGGDQWHELGEFRRPGAPPIQTIEMRLKRTQR